MTLHLQSIAASFPRAVAVDANSGTSASSPVRVVLETGAVLSLQARPTEQRWWRGGPKPGGMRVTCLSGELWVTLAGDLTDYRLRAGETLETTGAGPVVVQALTPATLSVTEE